MRPTDLTAYKETSLFVTPLLWLTRLCLRCPVQMVLLVFILVTVSIYLAIYRLEFKTSRLDLINRKSEFNQLWIDYIEEFGDRDDLVVVVEGPSQESITPVLDELAREIEKHPLLFDAVLAGVDTSALLKKGLHFVETPNDLRAIQGFIAQNNQILQNQWNYLSLDYFFAGLTEQLTTFRTMPDSPEADKLREQYLRQVQSLSASLLDSVSPHPTFKINPLPAIAQIGTLKREYFIADEGRLGIVLLKIAESLEGSFTYGTNSITKLREIIGECQARHPQTQIGLTGLTVMENDEMRISQIASTKASILSLLGVTIIFIAAFGGFRHPLIAVLALGIGLAVTMGYIVLAVGHLNILSMSFGVILIGLGIDFGIHYVARYLEIRHQGNNPRDSILATVESVGPGIFVGALTTATAFATIGLSEFTGIAELGIISAGGVLVCVFSALVVIPLALYFSENDSSNRSLPIPVNLNGIVWPSLHFPRTVLFFSALLILWLCSGVRNLWYDHNLLNMQPVGLESVELEMKLLKKWDKGAWFALSIADSPEELLLRKKEFEQDPTLRVDEIISRFPNTTLEKQQIIGEIARSLLHLPEQPALIPIPEPASLSESLARFQDVFAQTTSSFGHESLRNEILWELRNLRDAVRRFSPDEYNQRLSTFQQCLAAEILNRLHLIRYTADPTPPDLSDLPESLLSRYIGQKNGRYLMRIYSTHEIWNMTELKDFIAKVKAIDPHATGNPIQTYEASLQMQRSYQKSAILAFFVVVFLIFLDFRSFKYTLLVMIPFAVGGLMGFGLMGMLGIPFNPANTIVVPLILGIGVDDGVHLVHNYRRQAGRAYTIPSSLVCSVIITSLTTIIGFGSLMIAEHRGLQSLGRVLVLGIISCTFVTLIVMPAIFVIVGNTSRKNGKISER